MKKTTKEKIKRYEARVEDAVKKGTKCNMALKALKEVPYPNDVIQMAIKELENRVNHHQAVYRNATHNIAVAEMRDK